jgi:hypothetical protein
MDFNTEYDRTRIVDVDRLYTMPDIAEILGVPYRYVQLWVWREQMPSVYAGRYRFVYGRDLLSTIQQWHEGKIELSLPPSGMPDRRLITDVRELVLA